MSKLPEIIVYVLLVYQIGHLFVTWTTVNVIDYVLSAIFVSFKRYTPWQFFLARP